MLFKGTFVSFCPFSFSIWLNIAQRLVLQVRNTKSFANPSYNQSVFIEDFLQPKGMKLCFKIRNQAVWTGDSKLLNSSVCMKISFLRANRWSVYGSAKTHDTASITNTTHDQQNIGLFIHLKKIHVALTVL